MILNWKKPFGFHGLYKNISALWGLIDLFFSHQFYSQIKYERSNDSRWYYFPDTQILGVGDHVRCRGPKRSIALGA